MKDVTYYCDIQDCGQQVNNRKSLSLHTIFHPEQQEGKYTGPYISMAMLDLCDNCRARVLSGTAIHSKLSPEVNNKFQYFFINLPNKITAGQISEKLQAMTLPPDQAFIGREEYQKVCQEYKWKKAALADCKDQLKAKTDEIQVLEARINDFEANWVLRKSK